VLAAAAAAAGACGEPAGDGPPSPATGARTRVPSRYVLVGPGGATAHARPAVPAPGAARLLPGFGYAVTDERTAAGGERFLRLADGRWLAAGEVVAARPSDFAGTAPGPGEDLRFGWVIVPQATVHAQASSSSLVAGARRMYSRVLFTGSSRRGWWPTIAGWIRAVDVRAPALAPRPAAVGPRDRWLDVDLSSQTLVAYEGDRPVYATLVATGIGAPGSPFATPTGLFPVRSKHELARMDNLEHNGVEPYSYDVPLVQYFSGGKALHAALWHDRFGHPRSHGCVNLSPRDAEWVFAFTDSGTQIRVRGDLPSGPSR
jgi:lipoprotein-anchoring transpeptidase ErfK/SrfK